MDFADSRIAGDKKVKDIPDKDEIVHGGTLEVFDSKVGCNSRCQYIKDCISEQDNSVVAQSSFSRQYIFKYKKAILRVSFKLSPEEAMEYKSQVDEILGEKANIVYTKN